MGKEGQNGKDPLFKILICSTNVFLRAHARKELV